MTGYPLVAGSWDDREVAAMQRVIATGQFTMGENVRRFEERFARWVGSKHAVMVNSGSSANLLAIDALRYRKRAPFKPGDEIIVPTLSWSTTYFPVHQHGLKLVFVDIDAATLNLDPAKLKRALSPRTRAIFVPSILGNPAALDVLDEFCSRHGLELLEDNCESMGATLGGRQAGTFGRMGTFSCFFSHHISTMEGGLIVTDDEELHHILLSLRAHGWTRHLPQRNKVCKKGNDPFDESFRFVLPGYNVRPIELSGAIGLEQLRKLPGIVRQRRKNAKGFLDLMAGDRRFRVQQENGKSSWFGFSLTLDPAWRVSRKTVLDAFRKQGIEVRPVVAGNFLRNDVIRLVNHRVVGNADEAELVHTRGFFLGNHPYDLKREFETLAAALAKLPAR